MGLAFGDTAVEIRYLSWYDPNPSLSVAFNVNRSLKMNSVPNIHRQMRTWTLMFIRAIPNTYYIVLQNRSIPSFQAPSCEVGLS